MELIELSSILHMEKGKKPLAQSKEPVDGYLPYVDIKAFEQGIIDNYATSDKSLLCEDGDLLIVCDGSRSGLTGIAIKGVVGSTLSKIYADGLTTEYLRYFIQSKYLLLNTQKKGTGTPHLNTNILKASKLVVPSISEQQRIVSHIEELFSSLDNAVEILNKTKKQLEVYRQAVLKEAFEGKWYYTRRRSVRTDNSCREVLEKNELNSLPSEWKYVYLSDLGDLSRGKSKHRPRNDKRLFENGKYPFFQTGDVKSAKKTMIESEKKYGEFGLAQSKLWPSGTLCITIAANIAETSFLGVDGCFPDSIVGFTPNPSKVIKEYVRYFIEASKLKLWAFAPATAQKNINLVTLENLVIPYCSMDEQEYIVTNIESRLSECDSIESYVETILTQADAMRQSILKDAFEGRLQ